MLVYKKSLIFLNNNIKTQILADDDACNFSPRIFKKTVNITYNSFPVTYTNKEINFTSVHSFVPNDVGIFL